MICYQKPITCPKCGTGTLLNTDIGSKQVADDKWYATTRCPSCFHMLSGVIRLTDTDTEIYHKGTGLSLPMVEYDNAEYEDEIRCTLCEKDISDDHILTDSDEYVCQDCYKEYIYNLEYNEDGVFIGDMDSETDEQWEED